MISLIVPTLKKSWQLLKMQQSFLMAVVLLLPSCSCLTPRVPPIKMQVVPELLAKPADIAPLPPGPQPYYVIAEDDLKTQDSFRKCVILQQQDAAVIKTLLGK